MSYMGYIYAALAAALYGTNPIFAVPLYGEGMNAASVLLFRYMLGIPLLALAIVLRSERLLPKRDELLPVAALGIVMAFSSLALYESYNYMNPGLASTLLFMYPVLTAIIMALFFHEKFRPVIAACLALMAAGLYLLMRAPAGGGIGAEGFALVFVSALLYAVYLVMVKTSKILPFIPTEKSLLCQLVFGSLVFAAMFVRGADFVPPPGLFGWISLAALAVLPTVLSLLFTIKAIKCIGPTPTAIFGALEPITAVVLSNVILGETLTGREIAGGLLIILATVLVVLRPRG